VVGELCIKGHDMLASAEPTPKIDAKILLMALAAIIGCILRVLAVHGELWLDEAWSVLLVQDVGSPLALATEVRHDNNHLLNSLWLWLVGPRALPEWQRFPSLAFSLLALALLRRLVRREHLGWTGAIWAFLVALSYPLIVVGTEARGYSLAIAAAIAIFALALRLRKADAGRGAARIFSIVSTVGAFSHAAFILFFLPVGAWIVLERRRSGHSWRDPVMWAALTAPIGAISALGIFFYRGLAIGGGPQAPYVQVLLSALSLGFGGEELSAFDPQGAAAAAGIGTLVVAIASFEAFLWLREDRAVASLVISIILVPLAAVMVLRPDFILGRYFIISLVFLYLVAARWMARLARQGIFGACIAALLVAGIAAGNLRHCGELFSFQRSHFEEAVAAIISESGPRRETVTIGGGHENRNEIRLAHMRLRGALGGPIVFVSDQAAAAAPPDFVIEESLDRNPTPPASSMTAFGARYSLKAAYPAPFMSGAALSVYQRDDRR
jgi:uncharacterized membrane protein